jgi:hypothetical protein
MKRLEFAIVGELSQLTVKESARDAARNDVYAAPD